MEMPLESDVVKEEDAFFREVLEREDAFSIRRAVERLREGLFDPVAVRLLTAHEERLREEIERAFRALDAGESPHLCVTGSYGQGKSHCLVYVKDFAIREGFAASLINLDPREVPFRQFHEVYRELMTHLELPGSGGSLPARWKEWAQQQMGERDDLIGGVVDLLPERMPHLFKTILAAMILDGNVPPSGKEKRSKPQAALRPKEFPLLLARALEGEAIPAQRLRSVFKYRQIPFYKEGSLACRGIEPFFEMIRSLSALFRRMGYRGWVLLFDEGESIAQAGVVARSKGYGLLHRLFAPDAAGVSHPAFLYPVFAFTDDFFQRVSREDYDQVRARGEVEIPYFDRNYAQEWHDLNIYRLHDLSREEWVALSRKLIHFHARAYGWQPPKERLLREMAERLDAMQSQETRLKLKALVDCLDLAQQESFF